MSVNSNFSPISLFASVKNSDLSKAELIEINRNKQNKACHHQRCLCLSFYTSIIPSLFLFTLLFFLSYICLLFPPPFQSSLFTAASCALTCSPSPSLCNGQLSSMWVFICVCVCVLSVCTECCEWPLLADWRELKWFIEKLNTGQRNHVHSCTHIAKKAYCLEDLNLKC